MKRDMIIEKLEAEIVTLRKDLQKKDMQQNNTRILDNIINSQRPYYDRSGLGYNQTDRERFKLQNDRTRSRTKKLCRSCQRSLERRRHENSRGRLQRHCTT
jgi:hypothetical protein